MFYITYLKLCNKIGKKPSAVANELGMSRAAVNGWKHNSAPSDATLHKIADYFGVPVEALAEEKKPVPKEGDEPSKREAALLRWFFALPPEKRRSILVASDAPQELRDQFSEE